MTPVPTQGLFATALDCLSETDAQRKALLSRAAAEAWRAGRLGTDSGDSSPHPLDEPGRPARPELVPPRELAKRTVKGVRGRAALIHAVVHIEFNAINLAWDAVYRFRGLPGEFYDDWVRVAGEEAHHFRLMSDRLATLGFRYGDFPAHDGLWAMARRTSHDPLVRMAMIPRVMEARGLDVTPGMIARFRSAGDEGTAACLEVILRDEEGHVAAGSRWFRYLCEQRGLEPEATYLSLVDAYFGGEIRCPLNREGRLRAGFGDRELSRLEELCAERRAPRVE